MFFVSFSFTVFVLTLFYDALGGHSVIGTTIGWQLSYSLSDFWKEIGDFKILTNTKQHLTRVKRSRQYF